MSSPISRISKPRTTNPLCNPDPTTSPNPLNNQQPKSTNRNHETRHPRDCPLRYLPLYGHNLDENITNINMLTHPIALQLTALAESTITCSSCPSSTPAAPNIVTRTDAPTTPCSAAVLTAVSGSSTGGAGGSGGGPGGGANVTETAQPTPSPNVGGKVAGSAGRAVVLGVVVAFIL